MTRNRGIRNIARIIILAAGLGAAGLGTVACSGPDRNSDEWIKESIVKRENLDKAIPKISGMQTKQDRIKLFVPELVELYMSDNNAFDREVISALAASGDPAANKAFLKAAKSEDAKQVMDAARGAKLTKDDATITTLVNSYDDQKDPEVKRLILEIGMEVEKPQLAELAYNVLGGNKTGEQLDDILSKTPFNLLRTSCDVLAFQKIGEIGGSSVVDKLMIMIYHQDGVGRSLSTNCTRALYAMDKTQVADALRKAFKLEDKALMEYVNEHPDTLTPESIRNNAANALAVYRDKKAIDPLLDYIASTDVIPVPGTLAIRKPEDDAWTLWAALVGVANQSAMFAVNDIGVAGNPRAKQIFIDIFRWNGKDDKGNYNKDKDYRKKFKNAIELTGSTNLEVSARVNAFRILLENDLFDSSDEKINLIKEVLESEDFNDEKTWRPFARASIATDILTYLAVTSKAGDKTKIWQWFKDKKAAGGIFNVPGNSDPDAPKVPHWNDSISQRIDDVESTFDTEEDLNGNVGGYVKLLNDSSKNLNGYMLAKIMYEISKSKQSKYFEDVCKNYKRLDVYGLLYGAKALADIGTANDEEAVRKLISTLANEMNQMVYPTAKQGLEGVATTLSIK